MLVKVSGRRIIKIRHVNDMKSQPVSFNYLCEIFLNTGLTPTKETCSANFLQIVIFCNLLSSDLFIYNRTGSQDICPLGLENRTIILQLTRISQMHSESEINLNQISYLHSHQGQLISEQFCLLGLTSFHEQCWQKDQHAQIQDYPKTRYHYKCP